MHINWAEHRQRFQKKAAEHLLRLAEAATSGSGRQDALLMAAALLEQGKNVPPWIVGPALPAIMQDCFGMNYTDANLRDAEYQLTGF